MYSHCLLSKIARTLAVLSVCTICLSRPALAQEAAATVATPAPEVAPEVAPAAPKPKPKYSLPWALRPAIAPNVVRQ